MCGAREASQDGIHCAGIHKGLDPKRHLLHPYPDLINGALSATPAQRGRRFAPEPDGPEARRSGLEGGARSVGRIPSVDLIPLQNCVFRVDLLLLLFTCQSSVTTKVQGNAGRRLHPYLVFPI